MQALSQRQLFLHHLAQTSPAPLSLEIERAEGIYLYDTNGKAYIDFISGIAVSNVGHCNPAVVKAVQEQVATYMHLMVYGEYIQSPQVKLATLLCKQTPATLDSVYFVNSGSEATEAALKLAKRYTGRTEIIAFKKAYHGSTQGALSVMGDEYFKQAFRPLLPDIRHLNFNSIGDIGSISSRTAAVLVEPIQGEAGALPATKDFLQKLKEQCKKTGTLLIFDEIQSGFGRTGKFFAFEDYAVIPDILTLGKAMGGGMPIGAMLSSRDIMLSLSENPVLGHITTFGGHPVSCAAALANLEVLLKEDLIASVEEKEQYLRDTLKHPAIKSISGKGLMLALDFEKPEINHKVIARCIENGLITDWFLFSDHKMRIAPPLSITIKELETACTILVKSINEALS